MAVPVSTRKEDYEEVIRLINLVFGQSRNKPLAMEEKFPSLLGEKNMDRMRIIKENGRPVSAFNYVTNDMTIFGNIIRSASAGAVCTHPDSRGKGYSTLLVKDTLRRLKEEGVDFLFVSGDRSLYTTNNIHKLGTMYEFAIGPEDAARLDGGDRGCFGGGCCAAAEVRECGPEDNADMYRLYSAEKVGFVRSREAFDDLVRIAARAGVTRGSCFQKVYGAYAEGSLKSYVIIGVRREGEQAGTAFEIEYAGDRSLVLKGLGHAVAGLKLQGLTGFAPACDWDMLNSLRQYNIELKSDFYPGTMRIINFEHMMKKLAPFFAERLNGDSPEFFEKDGAYTVRIGGKRLVIKDDRAMHHILFGSPVASEELAPYAEGDAEVLETVKSRLVIPLQYPYNLNYI